MPSETPTIQDQTTPESTPDSSISAASTDTRRKKMHAAAEAVKEGAARIAELIEEELAEQDAAQQRLRMAVGSVGDLSRIDAKRGKTVHLGEGVDMSDVAAALAEFEPAGKGKSEGVARSNDDVNRYEGYVAHTNIPNMNEPGNLADQLEPEDKPAIATARGFEISETLSATTEPEPGMFRLSDLQEAGRSATKAANHPKRSTPPSPPTAAPNL